MSTKKPVLGRGLEALLGSSRGARPAAAAAAAHPAEAIRTLPVGRLQPGKYQPRTGMDAERLNELAESIKAQGVIQPIVVRALGKERYEIIAGERRWRAAQQAGLAEVPVVLREVDDRAVIAMALIENIQREDLNPLEEAQALHRLIDEFTLTHQQAADAVGRSRAAVSNLLRLLDLPAPVRTLLSERRIEMGHARALLTLAPAAAIALAEEAAARGLSVREVEHRAQLLGEGRVAGKPPKPSGKQQADADIAALECELSDSLGARVAIQHGRGGKGRLVIGYHGLEALDGILERLRRKG
jgi:ParB family chromosome partitioning protein